MSKIKIAIIGAMDCEVNKLKEMLMDREDFSQGKINVSLGEISGIDVIVSQSGVGKVNSAMTTQFIIDKYSPDYIINTGIAGGLADGLSVGDIVIGKELVQYDFDTSALGYARGYMCTGVDKDKPTKYFSDEKIISLFENAVKTSCSNVKVHKGIIATGDTFVSSFEKKMEIKSLFNAAAVEMEGCSIAQVANANSVPCMIIRALSDLADGSATKSLDIFEKEMAEFSSSTIAVLLENLSK